MFSNLQASRESRLGITAAMQVHSGNSEPSLKMHLLEATSQIAIDGKKCAFRLTHVLDKRLRLLPAAK